jgi:hypothetical protein
MRDCPQCGSPVDGLRCGACGYGDVGAPQHPFDPLHFACASVDRGQRCASPGSISSSTSGSGPWYCYRHAPAFRALTSDRTHPPQGFDALRRIDTDAIAERMAIQDES